MGRRNKKPKVGRPKGKEPLSEKHYRAIDMLSEGRGRLTRAQIAKKLKISRMALWKWMQRKDFQKALDKEIRRKVNEIMGKNNYRRGTLAASAISGDMRSLERVLRANDMIP